jgi:hypothetical protein
MKFDSFGDMQRHILVAYEILCKLELQIQISSIVVEGFEFIVLRVILDL